MDTTNTWLILYSSITGNTKSIAEAIYKEAPEGSAIKDIKEWDTFSGDLDSYAVVACGYWLKLGGPDPLMSRRLPAIKNKKVVFFETHGALVGSEHAVTAFARAACLLGENCEVVGTYSCQGRINPVLLAKRENTGEDDPHGPSEENKRRWQMASEHPSAEDFADAAAFTRAMQKKIVRMAKYRQAK